MIQPMQILVLGPEGLGRSALEETLTRLGYVVMAAEARPDGQAPCHDGIQVGEQPLFRGLHFTPLRVCPQPLTVLSVPHRDSDRRGDSSDQNDRRERRGPAPT